MKREISKTMEILEKIYSRYEKPAVRKSSKYDPFRVLITCLLSLRTKDENTEKAAKNLFLHAKTPEEILKIPTKKLEKIIYSSGFYKRKARIIKHVCKELLERFKGKVPEKKEELLSIKGIGQKTANIVLAFAYGKDALPIDTHCHRIPNRIGWIKTKTPEETEKKLKKLLPKRFWREFNTTMILFGRTICTPISPKCSICPIRRVCKRIGVKKSR
ncbi:MAG: endonuclease III [Candidatus Pacearchaeota archaeon]|nr:endonuclease III [Candidatus Pacearchaeota archaeon]